MSGEASGTIVATTPRLILRRFETGDLEALTKILAHPEVMRFSLAGPLTRQQSSELLDRILRRYEEQGFGLWAVEERGSGRLLGYCGLIAQEIDGENEVEIGYRLARDAWGRGLATEAARAARDHGFATYGFPRLVSIEPANTASIRVAEKNGMQLWKETTKWERIVRIYGIEAGRQPPAPPA